MYFGDVNVANVLTLQNVIRTVSPYILRFASTKEWFTINTRLCKFSVFLHTYNHRV